MLLPLAVGESAVVLLSVGGGQVGDAIADRNEAGMARGFGDATVGGFAVVEAGGAFDADVGNSLVDAVRGLFVVTEGLDGGDPDGPGGLGDAAGVFAAVASGLGEEVVSVLDRTATGLEDVAGGLDDDAGESSAAAAGETEAGGGGPHESKAGAAGRRAGCEKCGDASAANP